MGVILSVPLMGANTDRRTQAKEFTTGMSTLDNQNRTWVYTGPAAAPVAAAATCTLNADFTLGAAAGNYTADTAFATGDFGWVRKTASPL